MAAAALRALLHRSVDYAGMFPPCSLDLASALARQAQYVRDKEAWMLSSFVLPIGKFEAAGPAISHFDRDHPLSVSALGLKTDTPPEFLGALKNAITASVRFSEENAGLVLIEQLEMPLVAGADLAAAAAAVGDQKLRIFWEAPADAAEATIASLAQKKIGWFGYKLRTGGVTADAFPTSAQIAKALVAAARCRVPIKFTAGLHHPIRQFRDEVKTKMHGFLNVLGAAVLAFEHGWDAAQTTVMLEDEEVNSFAFDDATFSWREWKIDTDRIEAHRKFVTSFGSCSFDEPREDLRALNLL